MKRKIMYPNLVAEMARNGDTEHDIAKLLEVTNGAVSKKISNASKFKIDEIKMLCARYNKPFEELFR